MEITVVIPTYNGGELFRRVVARIREQEGVDSWELVVVDSGSTDGTAAFLQEMAEADPRIQVFAISKAEFGHGKTRNYGIARGTGTYIAMITQDALPAEKTWLRELVRPLREDPSVAGVFGLHRAYPEHGPLIARDLDLHFKQFHEAPAVVGLDDPDRYAKDEPYRQFLHFFSDNNAALRRSVWETIPYPDVAFGEDQLWAEAILKTGHRKAFAPAAPVYHSHYFSPRETFVRSAEESRYFYEKFGYLLCDSRRKVWRHTRKQSWRDYRYLWKNGLFFRSWRFLAEIPFLNYQKINGHYAGGKEARAAAEQRT